MLRRNIQKLKHVESLDVFPKVHEDYKQATASGGTGNVFIYTLHLLNNQILIHLKCKLNIYLSVIQIKCQY